VNLLNHLIYIYDIYDVYDIYDIHDIYDIYVYVPICSANMKVINEAHRSQVFRQGNP